MEYFRCSCGCGVIEVQQINVNGDVVWIEFLKRVECGRRLELRLKMMWRLLRYGHYYDDDIVLTKTTADALGTTLLEMSARMEKE